MAWKTRQPFARPARRPTSIPDNTERHAQIFVDAVLQRRAGRAHGLRCAGSAGVPPGGHAAGRRPRGGVQNGGLRGRPGQRAAPRGVKGFGGGGEVPADGGDASIGVDADAVAKTLTRDANGEPKYDKKTMAAFEGTTAAKVLSVRLDGVAYHAYPRQGAQTPEAAELPAKFLAAHAAACGAEIFAWLVDTNLAKESTDSAFRRERGERPPGVGVGADDVWKTVADCTASATTTTSATRPWSQRRTSSSSRMLLELLPTVPDLADEAHPVTLPRETWPAIHALVAAVFAPSAAGQILIPSSRAVCRAAYYAPPPPRDRRGARPGRGRCTGSSA